MSANNIDGMLRAKAPNQQPLNIQTQETNGKSERELKRYSNIVQAHTEVVLQTTSEFDDMSPFNRYVRILSAFFASIHSIFKLIWDTLEGLYKQIIEYYRKKVKKPTDGIHKPDFTDLNTAMGGTTEDINQEDYNEDYNEDYTNQKDMIGGGLFSKSDNPSYNASLFSITYIPAILTLAIVIFLIIFLVWRTIQTVVAWITFDTVLLPDIPISFSRPTTQLVYSIFFVITSIFLIFFLLFARGTKMKTELDIIQIAKELLQAVYILWPLSVLLIGSAIAKAFYKMACGRDKTNLLNFAKLVESSVILTLGIVVLIKIVLLIRPFRCTAAKIPGISTILDSLSNMVSKIINFGIIYAALRVITLFIEDIVSDKLVFFIAQMSKNVESPPVECNEEANVDETQSKVGKTMETIYMYLTGLIVMLILIFILVIQLPHPWMGSFISMNKNIGKGLVKLGHYSTKYISEADHKKACGDAEAKRGLNPLGSVGNLSKTIDNLKLPEGKMANQITKVTNEEVNANMDKNKILLGLKSPPPPPPSDQEVQERIKANMTSTLTNEAHDDYVTTRTKEKMRTEARAEAQAQQRRKDDGKEALSQLEDKKRGDAENAARAEGRRALLAEQQAQANKSSDQKPPGKPAIPSEEAPSPTAPTSTPVVVDTKTEAQDN